MLNRLRTERERNAGVRTIPRLVVAFITVFGVIVVGLPGTVAAQRPESAKEASGMRVDRAVTRELSEDGQTDFWAVFDDRADLTKANEIGDWDERGKYVYDQLTKTAQTSQADLVAQLRARGVEHKSFWITNAVLVRGGGKAALNTVLAESGVAEVLADEAYALPDPIDATDEGEAQVNAVEWGIANIRADQVWSEFGVRGEGIVVGSVDSGVEYTHPALVGHYRGNLGNGAFDHNYSWWDPSKVCGNPSLAPCDNNRHGTHTMGTMVGDDGAGNQIGVAPGARWIAAKGCETNSCSTAALLSAGQFMLAPTDLNGENPRPDLRPHIVNNSWGVGNGPAVDPFYRAIVTGWTAAGIFGVFPTVTTAHPVIPPVRLPTTSSRGPSAPTTSATAFGDLRVGALERTARFGPAFRRRAWPCAPASSTADMPA